MSKDLMPELNDAAYAARQSSPYDQTRYAIALRMLGNVVGKRVFDFGCGEGSLTRKFRADGAIVSGCDPSVTLAHAANAMVGGVEVLEQQRDLDIVTALSVTSFMPKSEQDRFWSAAVAALKPGGMLLHSVANTWAVQKSRAFGADPRTFPTFLAERGLTEISQDFSGYIPTPLTRFFKRGDPRVNELWKLALIPTVLKRKRCTMYFSLSRKI